MRERLIDTTGASFLLIMMLTAKLFTPEPRMLAFKVGTSGWLVVLLAGVVALGGYWLLQSLLMRFPSQSLGRISVQVLGKPMGRLFCLLYCLFFVYLSALFLRLFGAEFRVAIMPKTPISVLVLFVVVSSLFAAYKGLENLARMATYLFPVLAFLFLGVVVGTLRLADWRQLFPLFGEGMGLTLGMSFPESSLYAEILALGVMNGMLTRQGSRSVGMKAMGVGIVALTFTWALMGAVFPYPALSRLAFPFFDLTRAIQASDFVQRVEAIFVLLWFFVAAFKLSVAMACAAHFFKDMAGLDDHRPLLFPLFLIAYTACFLPANQVEVMLLDSNTLRVGSWPFAFVLPAITLAVAALRRQRGSEAQGGAQL